jgi:3-hydroxyacyl-CoA dehydrogenase
MIEQVERDGILEIVLANPPVNALGRAVREDLAAAIARAEADPAIRAVVIRGAGKMFSGGADITEFGSLPDAISLPEVIDRIEACSKPVIAAIHGHALGGGLELALGCHYRIATPQAKVGLPEVSLGILPGAGGTQRLPRLVNVEAALEMIVAGAPISAIKAHELGLIDRLADKDLAADAHAFAAGITAPRPTGARHVQGDLEAIERIVQTSKLIKPGIDAPLACIAALKAAVELPLDQGLLVERDLFFKLVEGDQSKALRHAFFAERAAAKITDMPADIAPMSIAKVGIIGAGTMGGGIAMNFLSAGLPVMIVETSQEALDRGLGVMRANYEATAAKGRMTPEQVERAMSLLTPTLDFDGLADRDLIIEAVYENMDVKKDIFARLDAIAKPEAILASNTSYLSVDEIALATRRPQQVIGLHFFSPANVMKLLEVVRGAHTALPVLATAMATARQIGKVPVVSGVCHGFIGNRMLSPRQDEATALLLEGASPAQIDRVHTAFGMPMGPFQMADLAGVDIGWHRDPARVETLQDALCAAGRWGQKTKAGFYDYDDKRRPTPSPVVDEVIASFRDQAGILPRAISDEEITVRTLYSMVNEGAKILEEGIAQRASDIDVVWLYGYGWPRHTGGPMFWAQQTGLVTIVDGLTRYAGAMGEGFSLSPLLLAKSINQEGFDD